MLIVSVSSHVAYGHVGNAALTFPLQRLGVEVLPVYTCQLSNHLGYGSASGSMLPGALVGEVLQGLDGLGIWSRADGLLSGFLGEVETAAAVAAAAARMKQANPSALYLLDPVLGDDGKLYARAGLPEAMRERLLPLADWVTPNPFELALLSGRETQDEAAMVGAAEALLGAGPRGVLVTSVPEGERIGTLLVLHERSWRLTTPRLDFGILPNGAGDILAGLFLVEGLRQGDPLAAARLALARLFALLLETQRRGGRELALVAGQESFVAPDLSVVSVEPLS